MKMKMVETVTSIHGRTAAVTAGATGFAAIAVLRLDPTVDVFDEDKGNHSDNGCSWIAFTGGNVDSQSASISDCFGYILKNSNSNYS